MTPPHFALDTTMTDLTESADHVMAQRRLASAATDVTAILHDQAKWGGSEQDLDKLAMSAAHLWQPDAPASSAIVAVLVRFIQLAPAFRLVNAAHDEEHAEFHWAKMRCLFGIAGYAAHAELATAAGQIYPLCPLDATESRDVWEDRLTKAHQMCGWPVTIGALPWGRLVSALGVVECEEYIPLDAHLTMTLLHVLKHTRTGTDQDGKLCMYVVFDGTATRINCSEMSNSIGNMPPTRTGMLQALGIRGDARRKQNSPLFLAFNILAKSLTTNVFIPRLPTADLPGEVLTGPWATLTSSPSSGPRFFQTGMALDGVWLAMNGVIAPYTGDDSDVLSYSWEVDRSTANDQAREQFERTLPSTYSADLMPADAWLQAFPNADESWLKTEDNRQAYRAMFDAVLIASFARRQLPSLQYEFPLVLAFPATATIDESTNQGKTTAALTLARAMVPALSRATSVMRSSSAPNQRALASDLTQYGTLCLDEWAPIDNDDHLLSHRNVQNLCVGGCAAIGKAMENHGGVTLRYSISASIKAADFPPDMINRSIPLYLASLSEASRTGEVGEKLRNGGISLEMRLAALHYITNTDVIQYTLDAEKSTAAWRFPWHNAIASHVFKFRTGKELRGEIGDVLRLISDRIMAHAAEAEDTGLMTQQREGVRITISAKAFFEHMVNPDVMMLIHAAEQLGTTINGVRWFHDFAIVRARKEIMCARSASKLLEALTGQRVSVTDRSLCRALSSALRLVLPVPDSTWHIPYTSYQMVRSSDEIEQTAGCILYRIAPLTT